MGDAKRRKAQTSTAPDISVLIPSRGRPEQLARCVASLGGHANIEIIVGLDEDDDNRVASLAALEPFPGVDIHVWPRHPTLGDLLNHLASKATGRYLMFIGDDHVIDDPDWPAKIVAVGAELPNGIGILYPRCALHEGFPSIVVMPRQVYEAVGYYYAPFFPYWFGDTWWDEIGRILGQLHPLPFDVVLPDGKGDTHGLVDLLYWLDFFERTRPMRVKDALTLARLAYAANDPRGQAMLSELNARIDSAAQRMAHWKNPKQLAAWTGRAATEPGPRYAEVKAQAATVLRQLEADQPRRPRVAIAVPSGRTWEAGTATDVVALSTYSALSGVEIVMLNVQSSMISNSRNQTVRIALENNVDYVMWIDSDMRFPPDTLLRLLAHGRDIVGAIYNKRVAPFETLGKMAGRRPERVTDGLYEALLLPGGVMLVKSDVYRTLTSPIYYESYRWPGADGIEAFKNLLRDYFVGEPPDAALASLDGSPLGAWLYDNYQLGEGGENVTVRSEDYSFCSKARKAGFTIWADFKLSWEVRHLGEHEVSCVPAEGTVMQEAAE